jgi:hypothetical protein
MRNLIQHAEEELRRAGLFDKDADYNDLIAPGIMKMIEIFSAEGYSGMSAIIALSIFYRLAKFKVLTPLTNDPAEWMDVSELDPTGKGIWQNRRDPSFFSNDGGKTGYSVGDNNRDIITFNSLEDKK